MTFTTTDINKLVIDYLPQYADGFRTSRDGNLCKSPEALLCREGMVNRLAKSFPGITVSQMASAMGVNDTVIRGTLDRIERKNAIAAREAAPC